MGCCCPPPGLVRRLAERLAAANQRIAELEQLGEWVGQPELDRINVGQLRERVAESERQIAKLKGLLTKMGESS